MFCHFANKQKTLHSAALEDDIDVELGGMVEGITMIDGLRPVPGGPFSTLTPSMWPQEILAKLGQPEVSVEYAILRRLVVFNFMSLPIHLQSDGPNDQPDYRFDEFGFRVEVEDGPEPSSNKLLSIPFSEDQQQRLQWIAHLEFSHNKEATELTWDNVAVTLPRTEKLRNMVFDGGKCDLPLNGGLFEIFGCEIKNLIRLIDSSASFSAVSNVDAVVGCVAEENQI